MHSLAMAQDILRAALTEAQKHDAKRIKAIGVRIGNETFMESDSLQFCLEAAAKGTIAEGARIDIRLVGITACGDGNGEVLGDKEPTQVTLELD